MELVLAPETTQIKDAYWTVGKSVLASHGNKLHPEGKSLAFDGRGLGWPSEGKHFGVFWAVTRTVVAKDSNLELQFPPTVKVETSVRLPGSSKTVTKEAGTNQMAVPPVLVNAEAVKKHTMLVAMDDLALHKAAAKEKQAAAKTKAAAAKAVSGAEPASKKPKTH